MPLIVGADSGDQGGKVGVRWYKSDLRGFAEGFGDVMPHLDAAAIVVPSPLNKERFEPEFERIADILQKRFSAKPGFRFGDVIGHDEEARGPFEQMCLKRGFHRVCLMPTVRDNARRCEWIHPSGLVVTAGALRGAPRRRGRARRARFPGLRLAYDALRTGNGATTVYNAANEVAVAAFIAQKIRFGAIARLVEDTLNSWVRAGNQAPLGSADDAIALDQQARNLAATLLPQIAAKAS